jgi:hypothetical protein
MTTGLDQDCERELNGEVTVIVLDVGAIVRINEHA